MPIGLICLCEAVMAGKFWTSVFADQIRLHLWSGAWRGGDKGHNALGAEKSQQCLECFLQYCTFAPKDRRFEHGGAADLLVSDPGRHLTSAHSPWLQRLTIRLHFYRLPAGVNENGYGPPKGFCFDDFCADQPIMDDPSLEDNNVGDRVNFFVDAARHQVTARALPLFADNRAARVCSICGKRALDCFYRRPSISGPTTSWWPWAPIFSTATPTCGTRTWTSWSNTSTPLWVQMTP